MTFKLLDHCLKTKAAYGYKKYLFTLLRNLTFTCHKTSPLSCIAGFILSFRINVNKMTKFIYFPISNEYGFMKYSSGRQLSQ